MSEHARRVFVLAKDDDYLRLALPAAFGNPGSARVIEAALLALPGVRGAMLDLRGAKLSIHFDPLACSHRQIALVLKATLDAALGAASTGSAEPASAPGAATTGDWPARTRAWRERALQWLRYANERTLAASHAMQAQFLKPRGGVLPFAPVGDGRQTPWQKVFNPALVNERAVINFANDVLAFYLIRVHWNKITQQWLRFPGRHADVWLAVFYLTFLLVRYRKRALAASAQPAALPAPETPAAAVAGEAQS
jgi:hypothetical protein